MSTLKSIIFDLDNTLLWDERSIDEAFQATCGAVEQETGVSAEQFEHIVRQTAKQLFEQSDIFAWADMIEVTDLEALWGNFTAQHTAPLKKLSEMAPEYQRETWFLSLQQAGIEHPGLDVRLARMFAAERRKRPLVYADTLEVLHVLRSSYSLVMMTNGSPDLQQEKIDSIPGLSDYFDHIIISGTFGVGKPDSSIFEHALKLLGLTPQEAIMIGDNLNTDILGAQSVGMSTVWINHHHAEAPADRKPTFEIRCISELPATIQTI
ncbi:HAD family hydrolase [Paenibacillus alba]|uniref:Phosphoserine phosphatase n=1 Tax=Paenibacillus alba TaxID=1197127 RepID=A0ABU6G5W0_9BACL|nr:HAD family hydrolase [Paenibacillus alba]MEC0229552.1 HAD family hydrolase [Paenibacillus alba]